MLRGTSLRPARVLTAAAVFSLLLGGIAATPASAFDGPTVDLQVRASVEAGPYLVEEYVPVDIAVTNVGNVPASGVRAALTQLAGSGFDIGYWGGLDPQGSGMSVNPGETRNSRLYGKVSTAWTGVPQVRFDVTGPEDANPADNAANLAVPVISPDTKDAVDGLVFADKDENGSSSPGEGLSGIKVVLTRGLSGPSVETTTDAEGKFSFSCIPVAAVYYLQTRDMPREWYIPDGGSKVLRLDGSGKNTGVTFRALRPLSASLSASMKLDKKSYTAGETAQLTIKLTNSGSEPLVGIEVACDRGDFKHDLEITPEAWGNLSYEAGGVTVLPGETGVFVVPGTVRAISANLGYVSQDCDFNLDASYPAGGPEASVTAKVTGMQGSTTGRLFHDDNANGRADEGEGLADQWLTLIDRDNGRVVFARSDATGQVTATGPAGRYSLRIAGWTVVDPYSSDLHLAAAPVNTDGWETQVARR